MHDVLAAQLRMRRVPWCATCPESSRLSRRRALPEALNGRRCAVVLMATVLLGGCGEITGAASTQPPAQAGESISSPVAARLTPTVDLAASCNVGGAGSVVQIGTIGELAWASHQIVVGTVVEILPPVWGDVLNPGYSNYRPIYTDYVVQVEQRLRGKPVERVRVRQLGGTIDGCTQDNVDSVPMEVGDRALLFLTGQLSDAEEPTYFLTGVRQGF